MGQLDPRFRGWYATVQMALRSLEAIERDVENETGVPMAWIEVLAFLKKAGDGRRRMSELADQLLLSRGGATRLIARMEDAGLVEREIPKEDRRATYAVVTAKGRKTMERVLPAQEAAVLRHFGEAIDADDAETLRQIALRVLALRGEQAGWLLKDLAADDAR